MGKERHTKRGPWYNLERQQPFYWKRLEGYWPCTGRISAVNAIGTQSRDLTKLGTDMMVVGGVDYIFLFSFSFNLTYYSRWTSSLPSCPCGHKGSSHLSPVHALQLFYRDARSALLQLVNQWLDFTYSRSHAFRYERKDTNPTLVRIELTTSALDHWGDEG